MAELPRIRSPQPQIANRIFRALERREADRPRSGNLTMSGIGECARHLWAERNEHSTPKSRPGRVLAIFEYGNATESHVIGLLRLADYLIGAEQRRVTCDLGDGLTLRGRIDGTILLGKKYSERLEALLEVKSAKASQFEECKAKGYEKWNPKYADQLQMYMGAGGFHIAIAFVYCKDISEPYPEKIRFEPERYEALKAKARLILTSEEPPKRPDEATSQYCAFCKWCDSNEWCWSPVAETRFDD